MKVQDEDIERIFCPICGLTLRFLYRIAMDDFKGECGHVLTPKQAVEQRAGRPSHG